MIRQLLAPERARRQDELALGEDQGAGPHEAGDRGDRHDADGQRRRSATLWLSVKVMMASASSRAGKASSTSMAPMSAVSSRPLKKPGPARSVPPTMQPEQDGGDPDGERHPGAVDERGRACRGPGRRCRASTVVLGPCLEGVVVLEVGVLEGQPVGEDGQERDERRPSSLAIQKPTPRRFLTASPSTWSGSRRVEDLELGHLAVGDLADARRRMSPDSRQSLRREVVRAGCLGDARRVGPRRARRAWRILGSMTA